MCCLPQLESLHRSAYIVAMALTCTSLACGEHDKNTLRHLPPSTTLPRYSVFDQLAWVEQVQSPSKIQEASVLTSFMFTFSLRLVLSHTLFFHDEYFQRLEEWLVGFLSVFLSLIVYIFCLCDLFSSPFDLKVKGGRHVRGFSSCFCSLRFPLWLRFFVLL